MFFMYSNWSSLVFSTRFGTALRAPRLITKGLIPILSSRVVISAVWRITPTDPVIVPVLAKILSAPRETR